MTLKQPKLKVGMEVVFHLGERENLICFTCGWQFWGSEGEERLLGYSNQRFRITDARPADISACPGCFSQIRDDKPQFMFEMEVGTWFFWAYPQELTPVEEL